MNFRASLRVYPPTNLAVIVTDLDLLETSMYISQIDQAHQYADRLSMIPDEVIEYFSIIIIKNHKLN